MEVVEERKETKAPPLPQAPDDSVLKSQLKAFEGEILNLRADNQLLEQDKLELTEAIEKLKQGVRTSDDTTSAMKTENQTLKLEIKGHLTENIAIQKKLEGLLASVSMLKQQLEEKKVSEKQAVGAFKLAQQEATETKASAVAEVKTLQDQHAMELGKAKREHAEEREQLLHVQSKKVHDAEAFFRQGKMELQDAIAELKETVTNQATRICSYERKIDQLDTENNRLRIQQQLSSRNKLSVTQQQEIEDMKLQSNAQQEDIDRLKMALDMININSHYDDFRGLTGQ